MLFDFIKKKRTIFAPASGVIAVKEELLDMLRRRKSQFKKSQKWI